MAGWMVRLLSVTRLAPVGHVRGDAPDRIA